MNSNKRGFTLIELLVVVAMIAVLTGAVSSSIGAAQNRARIQKATNDVKVLSQAILAYENFGNNKLPALGGIGQAGADADSSTLGFLLGGKNDTRTGQKLPVLIEAALQGGKMRDPWGTPYKVHIKEGSGKVKLTVATKDMKTGYFLPNFDRLAKDERAMTRNDAGGQP